VSRTLPIRHLKVLCKGHLKVLLEFLVIKVILLCVGLNLVGELVLKLCIRKLGRRRVKVSFKRHFFCLRVLNLLLDFFVDLKILLAVEVFKERYK